MASNNLAITITGASMANGVPQALFDVVLDDNRSFSSGAPIPFGTGIVAANLAVITAAKAAGLAALTPPPVFDVNTKALIFGGIL